MVSWKRSLANNTDSSIAVSVSAHRAAVDSVVLPLCSFLLALIDPQYITAYSILLRTAPSKVICRVRVLPRDSLQKISYQGVSNDVVCGRMSTGDVCLLARPVPALSIASPFEQ